MLVLFIGPIPMLVPICCVSINVKQQLLHTTATEQLKLFYKLDKKSKQLPYKTSADEITSGYVDSSFLSKRFSMPSCITHVFLGLRHPGLDQQLQSGPVVLPGGLHCDENVLQLQLVSIPRP